MEDESESWEMAEEGVVTVACGRTRFARLDDDWTGVYSATSPTSHCGYPALSAMPILHVTRCRRTSDLSVTAQLEPCIQHGALDLLQDPQLNERRNSHPCARMDGWGRVFGTAALSIGLAAGQRPRVP